jgi:GntR family transcriptional regulator/MocR family aminotransferase
VTGSLDAAGQPRETGRPAAVDRRAAVTAPAPPGAAVPGPSRLRYDLHPGVPDLAAFPRREWLAAGRRALARSPDHVLHYPDPQGLAQLREALAGYLARARGVTIDPERMVICGGFKHGLAVLSQVLRARGACAVAGTAGQRTIAEDER